VLPSFPPSFPSFLPPSFGSKADNRKRVILLVMEKREVNTPARSAIFPSLFSPPLDFMRGDEVKEEKKWSQRGRRNGDRRSVDAVPLFFFPLLSFSPLLRFLKQELRKGEMPLPPGIEKKRQSSSSSPLIPPPPHLSLSFLVVQSDVQRRPSSRFFSEDTRGIGKVGRRGAAGPLPSLPPPFSPSPSPFSSLAGVQST